MNNLSRTAAEKTFRSFDDTDLFYRYWPAQSEKARGALVLFHRGHEHSGRLQYLVDELKQPEFAFFAWDARGHGKSPGERGDSLGFGSAVRDMDCFIAMIVHEYGFAIEDIAVIAQSVGAVLATGWVHDYAPRIRALVLASPAFKVKLYVPLARPSLKLMTAVRGKFFVNSYVKAKYLTHDEERIASYNADPLISRPISSKMLNELYDNSDRLVADAGAIVTPVQLLISGDDWVVEHEPQHRFYERLSSPDKECHVFAGFYHDTLGEKNRQQVFAKINAFIARQYAKPFALPSLLDADRQGYTYNEYAEICSKGSLSLPKRAFFEVAKAGIHTVCRWSDGVDLGVTTGFDSGSTLDYIYQNQPSGKYGVGKLFDYSYLQQIGWRGIRERKKNLETMIHRAIKQLVEQNSTIRIVDIAAGHGRYVPDAIAQAGELVKVESVLLRDYSELNVDRGRLLIAERNLSHFVEFKQGNAFDRADLAAITPSPNLAIVSGLYELFPDNSLIRDSLAGLAQCVAPGGCLIYTNQPWHPQLAFIAHVLASHRDGQPWIMRRRTQMEMDQLVSAAGFCKIAQLIDEWGIFSVSLAIRKDENTSCEAPASDTAPSATETSDQV